MVEPYLNQVGGKVDNDVSLFTGGLNTYQDKAFLDANQLPYVMNMTMYKPPMMCTRPSRISMAQYMENTQWAENLGTIIDMWSYDSNQFFVIAEKNGVRKIHQFYRAPGSSVFTVKPVNDENDMTIIVPNESMYYFTMVEDGTNRFLYITGLTFKIKVIIQRTNPLTSYARKIEDGHYGICCYHKHRLFLATPGSNRLVLSAAGDFDNFDEVKLYAYISEPSTPVDLTNANPTYIYLVDYDDTSYTQYEYSEALGSWSALAGKLPKANVWIDPDTNVSIPDYSVLAGEYIVWNTVGNIVALKSFDDKLVIMCEHSMHVLYGNTPDTSKQTQYQFVDINNNIGCHSSRCVAVGGGRLFWLADDYEVYEYTGSSVNIVSRPGKTRNSTLSIGGISNIFGAEDDVDFRYKAQMVATSDKLYLNIGLVENQYLFIFDIYNRVWWCEDGEFTSISTYSTHINSILMARKNGDIVRNYEKWNNEGVDFYYNFETNKIEQTRIKYEFHTRVYGADGVDLRKSLSEVWFQARASATVYINDIWTTHDKWAEEIGDEQRPTAIDTNYRSIGNLAYEHEDIQEQNRFELYRPETYEQQVCYVERMYGQRLNAFQIIVKGSGASKFYLMKRVWRAR